MMPEMGAVADLGLPEHVGMLRATLRRFVEAEMPRSEAQRWDRMEEHPAEVVKKLAEIGVFGLTIPEEYGGAGRDTLAMIVTIEELSRRSMAVTCPYIMGACYAGMNILECGSEEQKRSLLPQAASGELLFAYGLSEPDVGSDLASVRTRARQEGDTIILNGAKRFCSGANYADYIYCLANTDPDGPRHRNLSLLLVPPTAAGVTIVPQATLGLKGTMTCEVTFSDVRLPQSSIVGGVEGWNRGWEMLVGPGLDVEKIEVAAMALGIASAAVEDAWEYARSRVQFGKPISSLQAIRHQLADARTELLACQTITYHAARMISEGLPAAAETAMAKLFVTETACRIVLSCQKVMGAYGYVDGFDMERYVRDVLIMPIQGGSSAIQRNNIANLLKLPR